MVQVSKGEGQQRSVAEQDALQAELTLEVNALRNAAYARGMASAKRSVAASVLGEWA